MHKSCDNLFLDIDTMVVHESFEPKNDLCAQKWKVHFLLPLALLSFVSFLFLYQPTAHKQ